MMISVPRPSFVLSLVALCFFNRALGAATTTLRSSLCPHPPAKVAAPSVTKCPSNVNIPYVSKTFVLQIHDSCNNPFNGQYVTTLNTTNFPLGIAKTPYGATQFIAHTNVNLFQAYGDNNVPTGAAYAYVATFATNFANPESQKFGYFYLTPPTGTETSKSGFNEAYTELQPVGNSDPSAEASLLYFGNDGCTGEDHIEQFTHIDLHGRVLIGSGCSNAVGKMLTASPMALRAVFTCQ